MSVRLHSGVGAFASEQYAYLSTWLLAAEAERAHNAQEISAVERDLSRQSTHSRAENGRSLRTFAPFDSASSALHTLTRAQKWWLFGAGAILLCCFRVAYLTDTRPGHCQHYDPRISAICAASLSCIAYRQRHNGQPNRRGDASGTADHPWPRYTILCPLYHEPEIVPQFIAAMKALDYPAERLQILVLTEQDDEELRTVLSAQALPEMFHVPHGTGRRTAHEAPSL